QKHAPRLSTYSPEASSKGESPSRVYSIGWAVSDCSISENDPRFVCAVVAYEELLQADGGRAGAITKVLDRQVVVEMRPKRRPLAMEDVSGLLGFSSPSCSSDDKDAQDQIERALSEIQMWALYACLEKAKKPPEARSVILIRGPLLPKL